MDGCRRFDCVSHMPYQLADVRNPWIFEREGLPFVMDFISLCLSFDIS